MGQLVDEHVHEECVQCLQRRVADLLRENERLRDELRARDEEEDE